MKVWWAEARGCKPSSAIHDQRSAHSPRWWFVCLGNLGNLGTLGTLGMGGTCPILHPFPMLRGSGRISLLRTICWSRLLQS